VNPKIEYINNNILKCRYWLRSMKEVRHYMNRALWESGYPWTKLSPTPLRKIFPGIDYSKETIIVQNPFTRRRGTSIELDELMALLAIVRHTHANKIIEVGTFDGNTTLNLALNTGDTGSVVTLDLPPEGLGEINRSRVSQPTEFEKRQYVGHEVERKITQVYGDSAELDWRTLYGPFDLAFIDGDHTSEYVLSDTANTLSVLNPGGIVIWHDYEYRSVAAVVDRVLEHGDPIHWIRGTRLAVARFSEPRESAERFRR
jgi:predicted O-methyltransferase YrrM